jgi:hypothetical protein
MDFLTEIEERRPMKAPPCPGTDIPCSECGQGLIKDELALGFRLMCDNHDCPLFRESQGVEVKPVQRKRLPITSRPSYPKILERRRKTRQERYALARSLGIGTCMAWKLRDRTRTDIEEFAKHD